MIGYIEGSVLHLGEQTVILKTSHGVGYEIHYRGGTRIGEKLSVFTAHVIREQSQDLFGFKTIEERELFYLLLGVNGVGPKSAYSLIVTVGVPSVKKAIVLEEKKVLTSAPGIGPKAAAQILLNLQEKISKMNDIDLSEVSKITSPGTRRVFDEVILACSELGFRENEVSFKVNSWLSESPDLTSELLIKKVLQEMAR